LQRLINKGFFWHSLDNDVSCAYPLQGTNNAFVKNMKMGEYHLTWQKAINILKPDGHLPFRGQEI